MNRRGRTMIAVVASLVVALTACSDLDAVRREKQIKTYWALTRAGIELRELSKKQSLTPAMVDEVVARHVTDKRDSWGNPIMILTRTTGTRVDSYVLISFGSDGRPDYEREDYFDVRPHSVKKALKLDVIVRDGEPISLAGK